jgi:uncharacterized protein
MQIKVEKPSEEKLAQLGIKNWPIWTKEVSEFSWYYDSTETCYILEGQAVITPDGGQPVEINVGDLVEFPQRMQCRWRITKAIRKYYRFE